MGFPWAATCRAHSKHTGKPCGQPAMQNGCCRKHGGKSLKGLAHPNYQGKGRSKYLPGRLVPILQESLDDEELMFIRNDIGLIEMRLKDLMSKVDTGEAGEVWRNMKKVHAEIRAAKAMKRTDLLAAALDKLDEVIERGMNDTLLWEEIGKTIDRRQRLIESERKRMLEMNQMITNDRLHVIASRIVDIFRRSILRVETDEQKVKNIFGFATDELGELFPPENSGRAFEATKLNEPGAAEESP